MSETKIIYKALAAFQQEVPVIHKATKGFNYTYADLPAIFEVIKPLLKKHKLAFYQSVDGVNETYVKTIVFHLESGEEISSSACSSRPRPSPRRRASARRISSPGSRSRSTSTSVSAASAWWRTTWPASGADTKRCSRCRSRSRKPRPTNATRCSRVAPSRT